MHMADALVSVPVAGVMGVVSCAVLVKAVKELKACADSRTVPLMGVMGAFVFAAQMINFAIPGTGASGHIVGGVLLTALLGPWAAFLTLTSVLIVQCLVFADGGLMALGCNIFNMGVWTCLVAYPLIFRPLMRYPASTARLFGVSVLTCVTAMELGAFSVTMETEVSGITALPTMQFLLFMLPIHLVIGIGEGLATAAVLSFVQRYKPELIVDVRHTAPVAQKVHYGRAIAVLATVALVFALSFNWLASSQPDGLEWSVARTAGTAQLPANADTRAAEALQETTALMPDYNTSLAGIVGGLMVVALTWGVGKMIKKKS